MVILNALDIGCNPSPEHDPGEDNLPPAKTLAPHGRLKVLNPRRHQGALLAQQIVTVALREHSASAVARHLGVSRDLVYGWGYGKTAVTLGDLLACPPAFGLRLLALAGRVHAPTHYSLPIRDRLWLCEVSLGHCLTAVGPHHDVRELSDADLRELRGKARTTREEAERLEADLDAEILRRAGKEAR